MLDAKILPIQLDLRLRHYVLRHNALSRWLARDLPQERVTFPFKKPSRLPDKPLHFSVGSAVAADWQLRSRVAIVLGPARKGRLRRVDVLPLKVLLLPLVTYPCRILTVPVVPCGKWNVVACGIASSGLPCGQP